MKYSAPDSLEEYLHRTEHAVTHFYAGLDSCWDYYRQAEEHWNITHVNEPMTPARKEALEKYLELSGKYFELKLSEAMFAGSILQMAYMAIRIYSTNEQAPDDFEKLIPVRSSAAAFCIGRRVHGVPMGLVVYAGRNQYAHWDEDDPHKVTTTIFDRLNLAFKDNMHADLAFSLSNPSIPVYSASILLTALRWLTYDVYVSEIRTMLPDA